MIEIISKKSVASNPWDYSLRFQCRFCRWLLLNCYVLKIFLYVKIKLELKHKRCHV